MVIVQIPLSRFLNSTLPFWVDVLTVPDRSEPDFFSFTVTFASKRGRDVVSLVILISNRTTAFSNHKNVNCIVDIFK